MKKIASDRNYRLLKNAHGRDSDQVMQEDLFDMLVANGLDKDVAAIVVSNIARMDMRSIWRKVKMHTDTRTEEFNGTQ